MRVSDLLTLVLLSVTHGLVLCFGKFLDGGWEEADELLCIGCFYNGNISIFIYGSYRKILPHRFIKTPFREGVSSSLVDNFVHVPFLYTPAFFVTTGMIQGMSLYVCLARDSCLLLEGI